MKFKYWLLKNEAESDEKLGSLSTSVNVSSGYDDNPIEPDLRKSRRKFTKSRKLNRIPTGNL